MVIKHLIITHTQRRQLAVQNALHPSEPMVPVALHLQYVSLFYCLEDYHEMTPANAKGPPFLLK